MHISGEQHPKFLMQVKRQEPVPKLISINQYNSTTNNLLNHNHSDQQQTTSQPSRFNPYSNPPQANYNTFTTTINQSISASNDPHQPSIFYTTARKQLPVTEPRNYRLEVIQLEKLLEIQRSQKIQLQQIIKQLTVQSEKLKQVNEHIVDRLKELQKNFVQEKTNQERQQDQRVRKVVAQIYSDVENYVRNEIQSLTQKLRGERMSPLLEKKLQLFMESMIQINQNTVEMHNISHKHQQQTGFDPLAGFSLDLTNGKENQTVLDFSRRVNVLFQERSKNQSFMSRSSNRRDKSSSGRSVKRLINNVYVTSNKRKSPSRALFQTRNSPNSISKNFDGKMATEYIESKPETFRNTSQRHGGQVLDEIPSEHIEFINPFGSHEDKDSRGRKGDSGVERKQYFERESYDESRFHVKEYTPNKRRKIFGEGGRSKQRRYETANSHW